MVKLGLCISICTLLICCGGSAEKSVTVEYVHPMERLPNDQAGDVVRKAIHQAGGWDKWAEKENFCFYKKITHVDTTGATTREVRQLHQYRLKGGFKARMTWKIGPDAFEIINNGLEAKKYKNGVWLEDAKSRNEAWNSSFGSNYVVSMPFKLTDPGVKVTYEGIDTTLFERPVHAIKVDYAKGAGSTGGMHKWWYYFDTDSYDLAGNYLDYGEGHSFTTYETFEDVGAFKLHGKRFSYAANERKEKATLKTIYQNEEMRFDQNLNPDIFELK